MIRIGGWIALLLAASGGRVEAASFGLSLNVAKTAVVESHLEPSVQLGAQAESAVIGYVSVRSNYPTRVRVANLGDAPVTLALSGCAADELAVRNGNCTVLASWPAGVAPGRYVLEVGITPENGD